jgi:hypothetical protein
MKSQPTELELETERIQRIADELVEVANKHAVLDVIEALGALLGTYLMCNGGIPALRFYLDHLVKMAEKQEQTTELWRRQ